MAQPLLRQATPDQREGRHTCSTTQIRACARTHTDRVAFPTRRWLWVCVCVYECVIQKLDAIACTYVCSNAFVVVVVVESIRAPSPPIRSIQKHKQNGKVQRIRTHTRAHKHTLAHAHRSYSHHVTKTKRPNILTKNKYCH